MLRALKLIEKRYQELVAFYACIEKHGNFLPVKVIKLWPRLESMNLLFRCTFNFNTTF